MRIPSLSSVRVTLLMCALLVIGFISLHQSIYTRNWNQTLAVTVFPINADGFLQTDAYIRSLSTNTFDVIDRWAIREAERYDLDLHQPFKVSLGPQIRKRPPPWPKHDNPVAVLLWGLRFRWWAYRNTPNDGAELTRIRMFVMYHEGEENKALAHSLGMQKGLLGLVHVFATHEQTNQNNIVIAHELLHTVGASDKYNFYGGPEYPIGFADPFRQPLYPQRSAEIMAGKIATNAYSSYMAESLKSVIVNEYTAAEINWID